MSEYTKLTVGQSVTFRVRWVNEVATGKWPEYHLAADDGRIFTAPKAAIDRQLRQIKLTPATLVGETVTLARVPNLEDATKSWWNLDLARPADAAAKPVSKRVASPTLLPNETGDEDYLDAVTDDAPPAEDYPVREPGKEPSEEPSEEPGESVPDPASKIARARTRRDSYLRLWDAVAAHHLQWVNKGIVLTDDGINATAATIWIDLQKANLL